MKTTTTTTAVHGRRRPHDEDDDEDRHEGRMAKTTVRLHSEGESPDCPDKTMLTMTVRWTWWQLRGVEDDHDNSGTTYLVNMSSTTATRAARATL